MKWKANIDEGTDCLRTRFVLSVVDEVALAGQVGGMPIEDVESGIAQAHWRSRLVGVHGGVDGRTRAGICGAVVVHIVGSGAVGRGGGGRIRSVGLVRRERAHGLAGGGHRLGASGEVMQN